MFHEAWSGFPQRFVVNMHDETKGHLNSLSESLTEYLSYMENSEFIWSLNPSRATEKPTGFLAVHHEDLIKITSDTQQDIKYQKFPLTY